ncbi:MAG: glycosyltransferase family 4 protein [Patescibacteria group bacterium]
MPIDKKIFVTPARMIKYKGTEFLLRSIKELSDPSAFFVIATPGTRYREDEVSYLEEIINLANNWGISSTFEVKFWDYTIMPFAYNAADALILPSQTEQFPMAILEAMASDLPVITTDVGGISEISRNDINCCTIKYDDTTALVNKISQLINNPVPFKEAASKAKGMILKEFTAERMANEYGVLFQDL